MNKIAIAALLATCSHAGAQNLNTVAQWEARFQAPPQSNTTRRPVYPEIADDWREARHPTRCPKQLQTAGRQ